MEVQRANIHILLVEELKDLLYEMNEIFNLEREVDCAYGEHLHWRLLKAKFYISFTASEASRETPDPREPNDFVQDTVSTIPAEGYLDRGDLSYAIEKALTHVQRMRLAYTPELEEPFPTLLDIIALCLTDCDYLIYGTTEPFVSTSR